MNRALTQTIPANDWSTGNVASDYDTFLNFNGKRGIEAETYFDLDKEDHVYGNQFYWQSVNQNKTAARGVKIGRINLASLIIRGVSSVASITSGILNMVSSQEAYKKNLATIAAQSAQVSGANDLSLLNVYNGQTAH